jgi:hypothetical protein
MKKFIAVLLASMFLSTTFVSCSNDEFNESSNSEQPAAGAPVTTTVTPLILSNDADYRSLDLIVTNYIERKKI